MSLAIATKSMLGLSSGTQCFLLEKIKDVAQALNFFQSFYSPSSHCSRVTLSTHYQLLYHQTHIQLKHYSFDWHGQLVGFLCSLRCTISMLSLCFCMHLHGHFSVLSEECLLDPTLDVRNTCAKHAKKYRKYTNSVPQRTQQCYQAFVSIERIVFQLCMHVMVK